VARVTGSASAGWTDWSTVVSGVDAVSRAGAADISLVVSMVSGD